MKSALSSLFASADSQVSDCCLHGEALPVVRNEATAAFAPKSFNVKPFAAIP